MKVVVLYRPKSEHARNVEEFINQFTKRYEKHHLEVVDVDSVEGISLVSLYDAMQYPSILVIQNDGILNKMWSGDNLPMMDEIAYYADQL